MAGARRTAFLGLRVAWSYAGVMMVLFVVGAPALVRVFAHGFTAADEAILPLAETLLRLAAVYTLADATQVVFAGALRGAGDTTWVMIISGILHWLMAVDRVRLHPHRGPVPGGGVAGLHRLRRVARRLDVAAPPLRGLGAHPPGGRGAAAVRLTPGRPRAS